MIIITVTVLAIIFGISLPLLLNLINHGYDFWWFIVFFLMGFVIFSLLFVIWLLIYLALYDKSKGPKPNKFHDHLTKRICEMVCQLFGVRLHIKGLEKLPLDKTCLYVSNHLSNFDPVCEIWALRYISFSVIYKNNLDKVPFLGKFLYRGNHISIDRDNNRKGLESIIKAIRIIEKKESNVLVYPEGTRSKTGNISSFHSGVFKIAQKAKCPSVVMVLENSDVIKKRRFRTTHVYLDILRVIEYEEFKDLNTNDIANIIHEDIVNDLKEMEELKY